MIKLYPENQNHECFIGEYPKSRTLNFAYSHGKLEDMVGYDIIRYDTKNHFDRRKNYDGEECIAVLPDGRQVPAKLFYWKTVYVHTTEDWWGKYRQISVSPHGLIVANDDEDMILFAHNCYKERRRHL